MFGGLVLALCRTLSGVFFRSFPFNETLQKGRAVFPSTLDSQQAMVLDGPLTHTSFYCFESLSEENHEKTKAKPSHRWRRPNSTNPSAGTWALGLGLRFAEVGSDLPRRADVCVFELFDSQLLGARMPNDPKR